jgi:hypothetical protein
VLFCLYGAIVMPLIVFTVTADGHAIYMQSIAVTRTVFLVAAGFLLAMGIGFVTRARWALPLFWAYFAVGTFWHVVAGFVAGNRLLMFSFVINLPIVYGIDRVTRPAFTSPSDSSRVEESSLPGRP